MFATIRNRLIVIAVLVAGSLFVLVPRSITLRERDPQTGVMRDTVVKQVPIKRGLDLQGGMHLALELDQSKQVSSDPKRDIDLALTVLRKRIDEFGVTEPLIQKVGDSRIVVELAGITDPARAKAIVQRSAFLEFKITDKTRALEKALPGMDRTLRGMGVKGVDTATQKRPSAVEQLLGSDSIKNLKDTTTKARDTTTKTKEKGKDTATKVATGRVKGGDTAKGADTTEKAADTTSLPGGVLESLVQPATAVAGGQVPGEFLVPETAFPRVDSLLNLPEVHRLLPRGVTLRWAASPTSVGVQSYRYLYALDEKSIVTGSNLEDARAQLDPLPMDRSSPSNWIAQAAASSARRPEST
jgi:preprotein translocase subunit SecD